MIWIKIRVEMDDGFEFDKLIGKNGMVLCEVVKFVVGCLCFGVIGLVVSFFFFVVDVIEIFVGNIIVKVNEIVG